MFERRPIWGLILGLNVCVLIWRISVQEPALLDAEMMGGAGGLGVASTQQLQLELELEASVMYNRPEREQEVALKQPLIVEFFELQSKQELYAGKHLLSEQRLQANDSRNHNNNSSSNSVAIATEKSSSGTAKALSNKYKYKVARVRGATSSSSSSVAGTVRAVDTVLQNSSRNSSENSSRFKNSSYHKSKSKYNNSKLKLNNFSNINTTTATPPLVMAATLPRSVNATTAPPPTFAPHSSSAATSAAAAAALDLPHLIDLHDFTYLMQQPDCHAHIVALILVHSAPLNYDKRALIRETWGSIANAPPLRLVFLLGAVREPALQHKLERENALYADMVQGSFVDDYRNMTYKHAMAFKWALHACAPAQILVKVDDDVYVNTPQLLRYLSDDAPASNNTATASAAPTAAAAAAASTSSSARALFRQPHELLFCSELRDSKVKRSYRSKWRVSAREYAARYYPPYCPGFAVIYSADVVRRLYAAAQQHSYFWIDDVHITGILAQRTNTSITTLQPYVLYGGRLQQLLAHTLALDAVEFLIAWHQITPEQMRGLWRLEEQHYGSSVNAATAAEAEAGVAFPYPSSASAAALLASSSLSSSSASASASALVPTASDDAEALDLDAYASYPYEGFR